MSVAYTGAQAHKRVRRERNLRRRASRVEREHSEHGMITSRARELTAASGAVDAHAYRSFRYIRPRTNPAMRVSLFITCLADQLCPAVGTSAVEVLRRVGCDVTFDERQTCCGQPAFNTGYREQARALAERFINIFEDASVDYIVSPSGSCVAMAHHFHELFPDDEAWRRRALALAERTYEFGSFLVRVMRTEDVGASFRGRVTWHDACHGLRDLNIREEPRRLLRNVRGAELVEMPEAEACCGFGGTFAVKYPEISVAILDHKIEAIERTEARAVVSGDASCLMQIGGRLSRKNSKVQTMHLAELLASQEG